MNTHLNKNQTIIAFVILVMFAIGIGGGIWFYYTQYLNKDPECITVVNETKTTEEKIEDVKEEKNPTEGWKIYNGEKYSLKYPSDWDIEEDPRSITDGSSIVGMNVFADEGLALINNSNKFAIVINESDGAEWYGRGGTCTSRRVNYEVSTVDKKLKLDVTSDVFYSTVQSTDNYCGEQGKELDGYVVMADTLENDNQSYYFHSESTQVSDAVAEKAIWYFETILETLTFK